MAGERRPQDTRERMLEIAEKEFAQKGYEGAHLESIAQQVGVRKTALYYYFDSKEALYIAVLEGMLRDFDRVLTVGIARDLGYREKLELLLDDIDRVLVEHPNYSNILIRIFVDRIPIDDSTIAPVIQDFVGRSLNFFHAGVKAGVFRKLSSRHLFITVLGMAAFYYAGGSFSAAVVGVEDVFEPSAVAWRRREFRETLLRGVLAHEGG